MSNVERDPDELTCGGRGGVALLPSHEVLEPREVVLGGTRGAPVRRTLPHRDRRMVGAWCFLDEFGPDDVSAGSVMRIPPHPHTGLQTVTWLLQGEVRHTDSLGTEQLVRPGQLNLMTAGRGIAHAEEPLAARSRLVHGTQLWVALPDTDRDVAPAFEHHADLPVLRVDGADATVLMGELGSVRSPATTYTPIVGADVTLHARARLPLEPEFEHAVLALLGAVEVDGVRVEPGTLIYLGCGRSDVTLQADGGGRVLLVGGEPFEESIVMWWNFIGRSHEEVVEMRTEWMASPGFDPIDSSPAPTSGPAGTGARTGTSRFGVVHGFDGGPLAAPALPTTRLRPRPRVR